MIATSAAAGMRTALRNAGREKLRERLFSSSPITKWILADAPTGVSVKARWRRSSSCCRSGSQVSLFIHRLHLGAEPHQGSVARHLGCILATALHLPDLAEGKPRGPKSEHGAIGATEPAHGCPQNDALHGGCGLVAWIWLVGVQRHCGSTTSETAPRDVGSDPQEPCSGRRVLADETRPGAPRAHERVRAEVLGVRRVGDECAEVSQNQFNVVTVEPLEALLKRDVGEVIDWRTQHSSL